MRQRVLPAVFVVLLSSFAVAQTARPTLYIEPSENHFEVYLAAAMSKKKVPVTVMTKAVSVTYTLRAAGVEEEVVGTSRRVVNCIFTSCAGNENKASTSVQVIDSTGAVVWSYAVNKGLGVDNLSQTAQDND